VWLALNLRAEYPTWKTLRIGVKGILTITTTGQNNFTLNYDEGKKEQQGPQSLRIAGKAQRREDAAVLIRRDREGP